MTPSLTERARELVKDLNAMYYKSPLAESDDTATEMIAKALLTYSNERVEKVRDVWKIQMSDPSSQTDSYMRGMANGLELAMSILEDEREPKYIEKPTTNVSGKER